MVFTVEGALDGERGAGGLVDGVALAELVPAGDDVSASWGVQEVSRYARRGVVARRGALEDVAPILAGRPRSCEHGGQAASARRRE